MAVTLVGVASPVQKGCELAETGVNLESFTVEYNFEFKLKLQNFQGQTRGFAIPDKFSRILTVQGEVDAATGHMAANGNTALVPANDISTWVAVASGSNAGGFYMDSATETQTRDGWRSVNIKYSSDPLVA
jgi:hypothetical protein